MMENEREFDLSYYNVYRVLKASDKSLIKGTIQEKEEFTKTMNDFLKYTIELLRDLERNIQKSKADFYKLIIDNFEDSRKTLNNNLKMHKHHDNLFDNILSDKENPKKDKNNRELLKDIISYIEDRSKEAIDFRKIGYEDHDGENNKTEKELDKSWPNKVFLSYAHDDKLYTYGLYIYFKLYGVYLHVDWMHNGVIDDPHLLKKTLDNDMAKCDQFLFCRSINSELRVKGGQVRQWCSWEIGNYYCKRLNQKFYTQIYDGSVLLGKSALLDTLKPLSGILGGKLV